MCPYALVYDRLALTDPALGTFAVFVAVLCLRLVERWRARDGLLLGLVLALAVFAKALGILLFFAPAAAVLLIAPRRLRRPLPLIVAYGVAGALTAYPLLRYFQVTATVRVAVSKSDASLLQRLAENLPLCATWLWTYWTPVLLALALFALVRAALVRSRAVAFVGLLIAVPILAFAGVGDIWFPRYLVFLTGPFVALAAWGADGVAAAIEARAPRRARLISAAALALSLLPAARADWDLLVDPPRARLVEIDRFQYVTGWPSGYGVRDTVEFVRAERTRHPDGITVVTHARTVRTTARALDLEFADVKDVASRTSTSTTPTARSPCSRSGRGSGPRSSCSSRRKARAAARTRPRSASTPCSPRRPSSPTARSATRSTGSAAAPAARRSRYFRGALAARGGAGSGRGSERAEVR